MVEDPFRIKKEKGRQLGGLEGELFLWEGGWVLQLLHLILGLETEDHIYYHAFVSGNFCNFH